LAQPKAADAKKWYRPGDWNETVLIMQGTRASITVNGIPTADLDSPKLGASGHFGFQVHQGIVMTLLIKDVEISADPGPTGILSASVPRSVSVSPSAIDSWFFSVNGAQTRKSSFRNSRIIVSAPYHQPTNNQR
jgi:hypothetical protein